MLCVLHQPNLARRFGDRILGLRKGVIAFADKPEAISNAQIDSLYEGFSPA